MLGLVMRLESGVRGVSSLLSGVVLHDDGLPSPCSQAVISVDVASLAKEFNADYVDLGLSIGQRVRFKGREGSVLSRLNHRAWCVMGDKDHSRPIELISHWIELVEKGRVPKMVPVLFDSGRPEVAWVCVHLLVRLKDLQVDVDVVVG